MAFGDTLARLAGGLMRRLHPTLRVVAQADELQAQGRQTEAISRMESYLGLAPEDYSDPGQLAFRLSKLGQVGELKAFYIVTLANLLAMNGRQKHCFALYACDAGINEADYSEPQRLLAKLRQRGEGLSQAMALQYLICFIAALGHVNLYGEGSVLLELDAGLEETDYDYRDILIDKIDRRIGRVGDLLPEVRQIYIIMLTEGLSLSSRKAEAIAVLEAHTGLSDYENLDYLRLKARALQARLRPDAAIAVVVNLCMHLHDLDRFSESLAVLEADLGLEVGDYADGAKLANALGSRFQQVPPEVSIPYVLVLVGDLEKEGRHQDAFAVLGTWVGLHLNLEKVDGWRAVAEQLRSGMQNVNRSVAITFLNLLAQVLSFSGQLAEGRELLEAYAELESAIYSDPERLTSHLREALDGCSEGTVANFVLALCMVQEGLVGSKQRIATLVDAYVTRLAPLAEPARQDPLVYQAIGLYAFWFELCSPQAGHRSIHIAELLLPHLRRSLAFHGVTLQDRTRFLEHAMLLRRGLLEAAYREAEREGDSDTGQCLWRTAQLWDSELSQRLLLERFRLAQIRALPGAEMPVLDWPFLEMPRPSVESHLPDPSAALSPGILSAGDAPAANPTAVSVDPPLKTVYPELFEQIEEILREGIDEEILSAALGDEGVLVRCFFGQDGRLIWSTLASDGYRLRLGPRSGGRTGDLWRLRWATARHDLRTTLARWEASARGVVRVLVRRDLRSALESLLRTLHEHTEQTAEGLTTRLQEVEETFGTARPVFARLLFLLTNVLRQPPGSELLDTWIEQATAVLHRCREDLHGGESRSAGLQSILQNATCDYLREVGEIWPLHDLADFLGSGSDVLFQVEDALHAVPLAHLDVGGEPLYRRVRSVRSSLSFLLSLFQREAEDDFSARSAGEDELLCISHFDQGDPAGPCAVWLHHGQQNLAREHGLLCRSAAESPIGCAGAIRSALAGATAFRTVTVCGHGSHDLPGVALADGLWQGGGADLSRAGWLILVSCSVGRLAQTGDRDVEGLCVQLALHRALSVLACRWPVAAGEAVAFANEAVHQYLTLRAEPGSDRENLRSRAVNLTRKAVLDGSGAESGLVGLNTAAAFELYGLG